jgi:hypothetical protein
MPGVFFERVPPRPLIIRHTANHYSEMKQPKPDWGLDHYLVFSGGLIVGTIKLEDAGQQQGKWFWAIFPR